MKRTYKRRYIRLDPDQASTPWYTFFGMLIFLGLIASIVVVAVTSYNIDALGNQLETIVPMQKRMDNVSIVAVQNDTHLLFKGLFPSTIENDSVKVFLPNTNVTPGMYGSDETLLQIQVNEKGLVEQIGAFPLSGIRSINDNSMIHGNVNLIGGLNIEVTSGNVINLSENLAFQTIDVGITGITLGSNTICPSGPLDASCFDVSGLSCPNGPLETSCLPTLAILETIHVNNLTSPNMVMGQVITNQTQTTIQTLNVGEMHIMNTLECTPGTQLDASCVSFSGLMCDMMTTLDASCLENISTQTNMTVTNTVQIKENATVVCESGAISDTNCIDIGGKTCVSPIDGSCFPTRVHTINGQTAENAMYNLNIVPGPSGLIQVANIANGIQFQSTAEANTASNAPNIPVGEGFFSQKIASDLAFKSLYSTTLNVTADILIAFPDQVTAGIYNTPSITLNERGLVTSIVSNIRLNELTATRIGTGFPFFKQLTGGNDFEMHKIAPGPSNSVQVVSGTNDLLIDLTTTVTAGTYTTPYFTVNQKGKMTTLQQGTLHTGGGSYFATGSTNVCSGLVTVTAIPSSRCRLSGPNPAVYGSCIGNAWDLTTFTVPEAGLYRISLLGKANNGFCGSQAYDGYISINGIQRTFPLAGPQIFGPAVMATFDLAVNDQITFTVLQSGATVCLSTVMIYSLF